jgi:hypothetical protein
MKSYQTDPGKILHKLRIKYAEAHSKLTHCSEYLIVTILFLPLLRRLHTDIDQKFSCNRLELSCAQLHCVTISCNRFY